MCTGRGLRYGVINDDCETSASFAMAENKTAACLRAHMMRHGFIDDGDAGPHAQSRDERFESLLQDLLAFVATKTGREDIQDKVGVIAGALGLGGAGGVTREGVELFMAAANILRQFDLRMELCIGTANAAAVGAAAQLSGHCYGMCIAYHHLSRQLLAMIVEGTRWVLQVIPGARSVPPPPANTAGAGGSIPSARPAPRARTHPNHPGAQEQCRPEGERLMTDGQGNMLNALSSLLMEMTKLPGLAPYRDAGCGLMRVMRQAGVPETFYKSIYVVGDGVVVQRRGGGSSHVVVGAPVDRVLRMRAGGPDDSGTGEIKVKYALVCREIEARCRRRVRPAAIGEAVVRMARETTVPAWSREHWARVIGKDGDDTMVYEADDTSEALSPEGMVRFAFTHQLYAPLTGEQRHRFKKEILRAVQEGHEGISRQHLVRIYGEGTGVGPTIDDGVRRAHAALATLPGKVVVERVFTAGGIVVAVCLIRPSDIATAHAACMNWAKVIIDAREAAEAGLAGRRPGEEPVGDIEVVAAE